MSDSLPQAVVSAPPFRHQPPTAARRWVLGLVMYGVMRPLVRGMEAIGRADKMLQNMGAQSRKRQEQSPFRSYQGGAKDVFVMTFAKSGTNWMLQIAHQLLNHGRGDYNHIHDIVPWPDMEGMPGFMSAYAVPLVQADAWQRSPEGKRVIKTHFSWDLLPYSPDARYIAVIRDPKDVFVSSYFFVRDSLFGAAMPSPQTWFRAFLSGKFMLGGSWAHHTAGYWAASQAHENVLVVSFKEMKRDLRTVVARVASFLGVTASDVLLDEVCQLSTFSYMKSIDHKFNMGKLLPWRDAGAMIRKGAQGGSSELLTPERQREIDDHFQAELRALGSDFPYAEFCDLAPAR